MVRRFRTTRSASPPGVGKIRSYGLDGKTFTGSEEESLYPLLLLGVDATYRETVTVEFIDSTTGTYTFSGDIDVSHDYEDETILDVIEEYTDEKFYDFTYEWDFNTLEGTIIPNDSTLSEVFNVNSDKQPMELSISVYDVKGNRESWVLEELIEEK